MRLRPDMGVMHNDPMLLGLALHPLFQSRLVFQTAFSFVAPVSVDLVLASLAGSRRCGASPVDLFHAS